MKKVTKKAKVEETVEDAVVVETKAVETVKTPNTALQALIEAYKLQNPKKAELKKAELELKANQ